VFTDLRQPGNTACPGLQEDASCGTFLSLHEEFLPGPDGGGVDEALKTIMAAWL